MAALKELMQFWPVILFVVQGAVAWAVWSAKRAVRETVDQAEQRLEAKHDALASMIGGHESRLGQHDTSIRALQDHVRDLPNKADLERIAGQVNAVQAIGARTEEAVKRIEGYMMEKSR